MTYSVQCLHSFFDFSPVPLCPVHVYALLTFSPGSYNHVRDEPVQTVHGVLRSIVPTLLACCGEIVHIIEPELLQVSEW